MRLGQKMMMKICLAAISCLALLLSNGCASPSEQQAGAKYGLTQEEYGTAIKCFRRVPGGGEEQHRVPTAKAFVRARLTKKNILEIIGANPWGRPEDYPTSIQWHHGPGGTNYMEFHFAQDGTVVRVTDTAPGGRIVIAEREPNDRKP
jgi:hypothetical protein